MTWYKILSPQTEPWIVMVIFVVCFALILHRKLKITHVSLATAAFLICLGIIAPDVAFLESVNWNVLALYWGYGLLAVHFQASKIPAYLASYILSKSKKEKHALLWIAVLAAALSSFMPNAVVVIMMAPFVIEVADRLKASLFEYLITLAISSNIVTTVSMVSDPPSLILALTTDMKFMDFYWFEGRVGIGILTIIGVLAALTTLSWQFRYFSQSVNIAHKAVVVSW
ncbi:Citrate transporter [Nitrosomonas communis]|uniref:Citrate transporter n=1 Tax=Nitrosomonas communis TaxID=44574 RepID=A0A1I4TMN0_9PROT|nr:SLC13 family permease [Nitrosomonas communis]SFM77915.1 Citrate transporter [Nitrosomonas communis]